MMSNFFKHAPDLAITPFNQRDFIPWIGRLLHQANACGRGPHTKTFFGGDGNSAPQLLQRFIRRNSGNFHHISFRDLRRSFHQLIGQRPVIGEKQQALAGIIEASHGIHTVLHPTNQLHDGGPVLWIAHRGHITFGLIQQQVDVELCSLQQLSIHANVIDIRVGLGAQFRHHGSIDLHVPAADQFFGLAPGSDSGCGNYFL